MAPPAGVVNMFNFLIGLARYLPLSFSPSPFLSLSFSPSLFLSLSFSPSLSYPSLFLSFSPSLSLPISFSLSLSLPLFLPRLLCISYLSLLAFEINSIKI